MQYGVFFQKLLTSGFQQGMGLHANRTFYMYRIKLCYLEKFPVLLREWDFYQKFVLKIEPAVDVLFKWKFEALQVKLWETEEKVP